MQTRRLGGHRNAGYACRDEGEWSEIADAVGSKAPPPCRRPAGTFKCFTPSPTNHSLKCHGCTVVLKKVAPGE